MVVKECTVGVADLEVRGTRNHSLKGLERGCPD